MRLVWDLLGTQWYIQLEPDLPVIEAAAVMVAFNCRGSWADGTVVLVPADAHTPPPTAVQLAMVYMEGIQQPRGWGSI